MRFGGWFAREEELRIQQPFKGGASAGAAFRGGSFPGLASLSLFRPTFAKNASEDFVNVSQLALQIKSPLDLRARNAVGDFLVSKEQFLEIEPFFPGAHGISLDHAVSLFARNPMLHQIQQKLSAE